MPGKVVGMSICGRRQTSRGAAPLISRMPPRHNPARVKSRGPTSVSVLDFVFIFRNMLLRDAPRALEIIDERFMDRIPVPLKVTSCCRVVLQRAPNDASTVFDPGQGPVEVEQAALGPAEGRRTWARSGSSSSSNRTRTKTRIRQPRSALDETYRRSGAVIRRGSDGACLSDVEQYICIGGRFMGIVQDLLSKLWVFFDGAFSFPFLPFALGGFAMTLHSSMTPSCASLNDESMADVPAMIALLNLAPRS
ncbi:hypothetical protein LY78DRAFT_339957 [Colletotrichum sublineola]|nr:hypothetical protein LY78DRAFT_339957 [Colletotrichum sublineola]